MEREMTKLDIFNFIKENLTLSIDEGGYRDYGGRHGLSNYRSFSFKLKLTNPETGKDEEISSDSFSIDLE